MDGFVRERTPVVCFRWTELAAPAGAAQHLRFFAEQCHDPDSGPARGLPGAGHLGRAGGHPPRGGRSRSRWRWAGARPAARGVPMPARRLSGRWARRCGCWPNGWRTPTGRCRIRGIWPPPAGRCGPGWTRPGWPAWTGEPPAWAGRPGWSGRGRRGRLTVKRSCAGGGLMGRTIGRFTCRTGLGWRCRRRGCRGCCAGTRRCARCA